MRERWVELASPTDQVELTQLSLDATQPTEHMPTVTLTINGQKVTREVENRRLLVQLLREDLRLTGTHVGCDTTQCGCCTVLMNGDAVKSCTVLAMQADGADVVSIEGIGTPEKLHPVQQAFHEKHGLQCGFCTPGMVMNSVDLLQKNPSPDRAGRAPLAGRQPVPLHRLSQHRRGRAARRRDDEGEGLSRRSGQAQRA